MWRFNKNFERLINYNNINYQTFSLPFFIVKYIAKNCNMLLSQNLMSACKYLRILQIRHGVCHLYRLEIDQVSKKRTIALLILTNSGEIRVKVITLRKRKEKIAILFKTIKIWDELDLNSAYQIKQAKEMVLNMDLSQVKKISGYRWGADLLISLIPHTIQELILSSPTSFNATFFYEKMQNVTNLELIWVRGGITPQLFKQLIGIKKKTKFIKCKIDCNMSLDLEVKDIFNFADTHMENNGSLVISFRDYTQFHEDNYKRFSSEINGLEMIRKQRNILTCQIKLDITLLFRNSTIIL